MIITDLRNPPHKYDVIVADPPWSFEVWGPGGSGRSASQHYQTMGTYGIVAMRDMIDSISAPDCALFLWAVRSSIPEALEVMSGWGFTYKTVAFTWAKTTKLSDVLGPHRHVSRLWNGVSVRRVIYEEMRIRFHVGLGLWTRSNCEFVLLGTRGKPHRDSKGVRDLIVAPIGKHSEKPDEMYKRVESLMGDKKRIDLFARKERDGWDVWGNEV